MTVRIGFIGAGIIASRHLGNLLSFHDVDVVAVADLLADKARAMAQRCGGVAYREYNEMLERERLDGIYICIPPFAHGAPEAAVVERGLPFFVEKPLATSFEVAEAIASEVRARNLITATGYHWRYLDVTERAQELLSKNPARLALGYWLDFTPPPVWWSTESLSGGQFMEQTTHVFDLAQLLLGDVTKVYAAGARTPRAAYPQSDIWDVSVATLHFASGALGTMASTCLLNWPHRIGLHLFCEGMAIELTEFDIMVDVGKGRPMQKAEGDPMLCEDRDFIDAVQGKPNRIRVPYTEALKTHRLVTTAVRSAREGCVLELGTEQVYV